MADQPDDRPASLWRPPQFTIRGLMATMFGVAVGMSAMSIQPADWTYGLLAAVGAWIVLGLLNQIVDLWSTFHRRLDLSDDQRWGWRFAVFWRAGVICLLVGYYVVSFLLDWEVISLPEHPECFLSTGSLLRDAVCYLSFVIVLSSVPRPKRERPKSLWFSLVSVLGAIAAAVLCLALCMSHMLLAFVIHIALAGMEMAVPPRFALEGVNPDLAARSHVFFLWSLAAAVSVLADLALIRLLARQWTQGVRRRLVWTGLLVPSLAITAWYPIWVHTAGLYGVSPWMVEAQETGPLHRWVCALLLLIILVTAATWRMVGVARPTATAPDLDWRRRMPSYYHERCVVIGALTVGLTAVFVGELTHMGFALSLFYAPGSLLVAAILIALHRLLTAWFRPAYEPPPGPPELPLPRFCAIWLAGFVTAVFGIPTIGYFGFAIWMGPW